MVMMIPLTVLFMFDGLKGGIAQWLVNRTHNLSGKSSKPIKNPLFSEDFITDKSRTLKKKTPKNNNNRLIVMWYKLSNKMKYKKQH